MTMDPAALTALHDRLQMREAMGRFATGVTVITTVAPDGAPVGCTVNAFSSLSLDPPLVLVCVGRERSLYGAVHSAPGYTVNILAADQRQTAMAFARSGDNAFTTVPCIPGRHGIPRLDGAIAHVECDRYDLLDGGDHVIVIGRVAGIGVADGDPLLYFQGAFLDAPPAHRAGRTDSAC